MPIRQIQLHETVFLRFYGLDVRKFISISPVILGRPFLSIKIVSQKGGELQPHSTPFPRGLIDKKLPDKSGTCHTVVLYCFQLLYYIRGCNIFSNQVNYFFKSIPLFHCASQRSNNSN